MCCASAATLDETAAVIVSPTPMFGVNAQGRPLRIVQHNADGSDSTRFTAPEQDRFQAAAAEQPVTKP